MTATTPLPAPPDLNLGHDLGHVRLECCHCHEEIKPEGRCTRHGDTLSCEACEAKLKEECGS